MAYVNRSYRKDAALHRYGRRGRGMSGLGDASSCTSPGQVWCPEYVFNGLPPGQCTTQAQCDAFKAASGGSSGGGGSSSFDNFMKGFANVFGPQQPMYAPAPVQSGISTTTLVIGGVALVGIALLLKSRS